MHSLDFRRIDLSLTLVRDTHSNGSHLIQETHMLRIAVVFFLLALVAGLFGFNVLASTFGDIAQIAFWIFAFLFGLTLIGGLLAGRTAVDAID
jgi:uncharacterized membrane protein YtjA (UPF0391 family)